MGRQVVTQPPRCLQLAPAQAPNAESLCGFEADFSNNATGIRGMLVPLLLGLSQACQAGADVTVGREAWGQPALLG